MLGLFIKVGICPTLVNGYKSKNLLVIALLKVIITFIAFLNCKQITLLLR